MDSFEFVKILGAACGSLLILMLVETAATSVVNPEVHAPLATLEYDDHHASHNAYPIEVETASAEAEAVEEEVPFEEFYAVADASAGERLFRACQSCHKLEQGANGTGPYLYGVVGRDKAAAEGFNYSSALAGMGGAWSPDNLNSFLENPKGYVPGTSMAYNGMRDIEDRANLIAYLETNAD